MYVCGQAAFEIQALGGALVATARWLRDACRLLLTREGADALGIA